MKKPSITLLALIIGCHAFGQLFLLKSPAGKSAIQVTVGHELTYSVIYDGNIVIQNSPFSLKFNQAPLFGKNLEVVSSQTDVEDETWKPVVGRYATVRNHYNELSMRVREKDFPAREINLIFRAYDDGVAFRYQIPESWVQFIPNYQQTDHLLLMDENSTFHFTGDFTCWAANYGGYSSHQESEFEERKLSSISPEEVIGVPLLVRVDQHVYAAITEADLTDWAGMYLGSVENKHENGTFTLTSKLAPLHAADGRVKVKPGQFSPWRVLMLGEKPGDLVESEIIPNLNDPCAIADPSWIEPGISAWDHWWSGEVKMDTETIKKYIQLAADMGWKYMIIDWNWYGAPFAESGGPNPDANILTYIPEVDMPGILEFAKSKNVKIVLWLLWNHVDEQMDEAFALYEKWGVAGVKIDFMARDDQDMVSWYHKVVKKAAEHHLVVDFHGAYKPTGLRRTYPNLITREGVMGNEYSKWSTRITPEHTCTLPFTRMLAGPMDFTPGGFLNKAKGQFRCGAPAEVMGTRCHQLAMFVIYDSPFTVACDHPDNYKGQPGIGFLKLVPTVWDDTHVLNGDVGHYISMARKHGNKWFVGAMTDSNERTMKITLDFLEKGRWELHYFRDTNESNTYAEKLEMGTAKVNSGDEIEIYLAQGGGYAAYLVPVK